MERLLGGSDIEAILQRLDRLTVEESQMAAKPITEVIFSLFKNMNAVMDGMEHLLEISFSVLNVCPFKARRHQ